MNLLIDTHILIWYIAGHPSLNKKMINLLEDPANDLFISVASLWEISIKVGKGKLDLGIEFHELEAILGQLSIQILPVLFGDLNVYLTLPFHHSDPFNRLIIRQESLCPESWHVRRKLPMSIESDFVTSVRRLRSD